MRVLFILNNRTKPAFLILLWWQTSTAHVIINTSNTAGSLHQLMTKDKGTHILKMVVGNSAPFW